MNIDLLQEILTNSTPGPWEWNRSDHTCWLGAPQIDVLRSISSGYSGETDIDIDEANARLIAMAPDLAAEVLRLRAALAVFADTKSYLTNGPCDPESPKFSALKIARAALKTKGTE